MFRFRVRGWNMCLGLQCALVYSGWIEYVFRLTVCFGLQCVDGICV